MLTGAILDRFHIKAPLARGGMGELWLADDVHAHRSEVVLKTVRADLVDDDEVRQSFEREIRVTSRLDHAHVVRHVAHGRWQGVNVLALERISGLSLAELCARQRLPLGAALCIARDIADALAYVHRLRTADGAELGVVHGDVTPHNILIDARGDAHLIDFGAVKLTDDPNCHDVIGKPGYLSPEQSRGDVVAAASDQYSLGIVLWELVTGADLFEGDARRRGRVIASPSSLTNVPRVLDDVVLKMLAYDPRDRYADCASASAALGELEALDHDDAARNDEGEDRAWLADAVAAPRVS